MTEPRVIKRRRNRAARVSVGMAPGLVLGIGALLAGAGTIAALGVFAVACGGASAASSLLARRFVQVTVRGPSMLPTYEDGDRLLVRRTHAIRSGDVVVIDQPRFEVSRKGPGDHVPEWKNGHGWMIKRAVAVPGERIPRAEIPELEMLPGDRVPEGMLVVLGDNREESFDSRHLGFVSLEKVLGVPMGRRK